MESNVQIKNNRTIYIFFSLLLFSFPLRESFAIMLGDTPLRIGEILMGLSPILYVVYKRNYIYKNHAVSSLIIIFLLYSLLFGVLFAHYLKPIYVLKYYIRGFLFLFLIKIAEDKVIYLSDRFFEKLFKYTVVIETLFCIMQFLGFDILYGSFGPYEMSAEFGIPRLSGTASEPGYLIPILTPGFYFFINDFKKYKIWAFVSFLLIFLTFSSFGYVIVLFVIFVKILVNNKNSIVRYLVVSSIALSISLVAISVVYPGVGEVFETLSSKIFAFATMNEDDMDYSGAERTENLLVAMNAYESGSLYEKTFGQGIGATAYYTNKEVVLHLPAEEAGNVYLCTLLNQGLFGLLLLVLLLWKIKKKVIKTPISISLFVGVLTQLLQYFIVGNLWLYFFWYEIAFIIIIHNQNRLQYELQGNRREGV